MNDDYAAQRRAYVNEIRSSFANSGTKSEKRLPRTGTVVQTDADTEEVIGAFAVFKIKFLLCLFIFAAFVVCDRTGIEFFSMSADAVYERVSQNYDYTNLKKYVMMVSDFDKNE